MIAGIAVIMDIHEKKNSGSFTFWKVNGGVVCRIFVTKCASAIMWVFVGGHLPFASGDTQKLGLRATAERV